MKLFKKKSEVIEKKLNLLVGLVVIVVVIVGFVAARNPQLLSAWMTGQTSYTQKTAQTGVVYQAATEVATTVGNISLSGQQCQSVSYYTEWPIEYTYTVSGSAISLSANLLNVTVDELSNSNFFGTVKNKRNDGDNIKFDVEFNHPGAPSPSGLFNITATYDSNKTDSLKVAFHRSSGGVSSISQGPAEIVEGLTESYQVGTGLNFSFDLDFFTVSSNSSRCTIKNKADVSSGTYSTLGFDVEANSPGSCAISVEYLCGGSATKAITVKADTDGDGVIDTDDNCPNDPNPDQIDADQSGFGDACEPDADGDGIFDYADNCIDLPNADQADRDSDGVGDACTAVTIGSCVGPQYGAGYRLVSVSGGDGDIIWSYTGGTGSEAGNRNQTLTLVYPNADATYTVTACDQLGQCASCDIPINEGVGIANCPEEILGYDEDVLIPVRPNIKLEAVGGTTHDWTLMAYDETEQYFSGSSIFLQDLPAGEYHMNMTEPDNSNNRDSCDFTVVPYNVFDLDAVAKIYNDRIRVPSEAELLILDTDGDGDIDIFDLDHIVRNRQ